MTKTITASEAKTHFFELLKGVNEREDEIVITKDGKPAAVFLSFQEFEQLIETIELLSDQKAMKQINQARAYIKRGGKLLTHEEIFGPSIL